MKKGLTEIAFVLDESGSMEPVTKDTIGGFNQFIKDQKKMPGEAKFTLVKFSSSWNDKDAFTIVYDGANLADVKKLNSKTYSPGGGTALLDAVGNTISTIDKRHKKLKKPERPEKTLVVILTDGEENSSKEYKSEGIIKLVKKSEKKGWTFLFLGADIDAWDQGSSIGMNVDFSIDVSSAESLGTFSKVSSYTASYRSEEDTMDVKEAFAKSDKEVQKDIDKFSKRKK